MKFICSQAFILICLLSCVERKQVYVLPEVSSDETMKGLDTSWNNFESKILVILGTTSTPGDQLEEGKAIYRMIKYDSFQQNSELYELNNFRNKIELKYWKFEIDRDCNPVTGPRNFTSDCVIVKEKSVKYISEAKFDSIAIKLKENEFWELSEFESEKNNHRGWINDEPSWVIEAISIDRYKLNWDSVVLVRNHHRIERSFIEQYPSVFNIGTYIKSL